MEYRTLGKTGMKASIIGLGAEHLDGHEYPIVEETIHAALENDINIIDVFMPGADIRKKIGKAIKGNREKLIIQGHICSTDINEQYDVSRDMDTVKRYFENLLTDLQTDYIDLGMLFLIDNQENFDKVFNSEILQYALDLKSQGVIKAIGASSHNPIIAKKIVETEVVELLMFSLNPAFDLVPAEIDVRDYLSKAFEQDKLLETDKDRAALYKLCENLGIPITVMKTLAGGKILNKEHTPFGEALTVGQSIHYALSTPAVASVLIGCQSRKEVEEAVKYLTLTDEERDYTKATSKMNADFTGNCVYCNHCLPCPSSIDIASVTKYMDMATQDPSIVNKGVGEHYKELESHGSDCIQCGECETRCPFDVEIIKNMEKSSQVFGY